jgi:UDP-2,3-diacylglucosamine pyrophosphatase LpxH
MSKSKQPSPCTVAILSDIHVGPLARTRDLCPDKSSPIIDDNFLDKFRRFVTSLPWKPDYLVLPGDLTETSAAAQISIADTLLTTCLNAFALDPSRVLFVPGNHDVEWAVLADAHDHIGKQRRYDRLRDPRSVIAKVLSNCAGNILETPYLATWDYPDLLTVGFNSSWHDNPTEALHHGRIELDQLEALAALLKKLDLSKRRPRLFLVHHHPLQYQNVIAGESDFSTMQNSDALLSLLSDSGFDFLIHGHIHQPRFQTLSRDGHPPLSLLSAGSFSYMLPRAWEGRVNNQFHLLRIMGRHSATGHLKGVVHSWSYYVGAGWTESKKRDGIGSHEPFGAYPDSSELDRALDQHLADLLVNGWTDFETLVGRLPDLEFVRPDRLIDALRRAQPRAGFKIHGESLTDLVLLKEVKP